jgi:hypothetical protein
MIKILKRIYYLNKIRTGEAILRDLDTFTRECLKPEHVPEEQADQYIALMALGADVLNRMNRYRRKLAALK